MDNCPVCAHEINKKEYSSVLDGILYVFCCRKCKENFTAEPRKYVNCCEQKKEKEMKFKVIILSAIALMFSAGQSFAGEGHVHESMAGEKGSAMEKHGSEAHNVGNKICPVSGEKIGGAMGEGVEVEHEGKIYNLCCTMCAKDFKKDPAKYIKIINKELGNSKNEDHVESKESHKEEHDHNSHGH